MRGHLRQRAKGSWSIKVEIGNDPSSKKRVSKWYTVRGGRRVAERELARILSAIDAVDAAVRDGACNEAQRLAWCIAAIDAARSEKENSQAELARVVERIRDGQPVDPSKITVGQYLKRWLDTIQSSVSRKTFEFYGQVVHLHLVPALGSLLLLRLSSIDIEQYYSRALVDGSRRVRKKCADASPAPVGLSSRSIVHHHRILSQALRKAVEARPRLLDYNPAKAVRPPKPERREIRVLTDDEIKRLLVGAHGSPNYTPILVALTTGLRRGELLALRWRDMDLDKGALTVAQSLEETNDGLYFKTPKTKKSRRTITLPAVTVEALRRHEVEQAKERLKIGLGRDRETLVFARLVVRDEEITTAPLVPKDFGKTVVRIARRAGIDAVTLHGLRHTHITQLLARGVQAKVVSERAGHSSVAFTLDVYGHVLIGMQDQATAVIEDAFRGAVEKNV